MPNPETFDELAVWNQVLTRMGEDPVTALTGDTVAHDVLGTNYRPIAQAALSRTSWRDATTKAALSKLTEVPAGRYAAKWQLPNDLIKILYVYPPLRYERQGQEILTDETSSIVLDYVRWVPEGDWPDHLREYVVNETLVKCVKGVTGKDPTRQQLAERDKSEREAFNDDSGQQPNFEHLPNPFIDCRG